MASSITIPRRSRPIRGVAGLLLLLLSAGNVQAQLAISGVTTVDVTPSGFSVIWEASLASTPSIIVYADSAGTQDITSQFDVTLFPVIGGDPQAPDPLAAAAAIDALRAAARGLGLMKVRVAGASPDTTYYYRVGSDTTTESVTAPLDPAAVTTAGENSFISGSHQLVVTVGAGDSRGWLVTAQTSEALYPVSGYVGDGAAQNRAFINLSHLFQTPTGNWDPSGNKTVTVTVLRGGNDTSFQDEDIAFSNQFSVSVLYPVQAGGPAPLITVVEPARDRYTTGESVTITWVDEFPSAGATVSLYYDADNTGADGVLIASGIPEEVDAAGDTFDWDTTGVADGIYYLYATVTDTVTTDTDYGSGRVAIDRAQNDSDTDSMADLWETLFFGGLGEDGTGDADNDGSRDGNEFAEQTDPLLPDLRMALVPGLNLVSFPIALAPARDSAALLNEFGGAVISISRVDVAGNTTETTEWNGGVIAGPVFPIDANEGYYFELASAAEAVFGGTAVSGTRDLVPGTNLIGFTGVPQNYTAFDLLQAIGDGTVVSSVARFDLDTGRFDTAVYDGTAPSGVDFPVERGRAYVIGMGGTVNAFSP